MKLQEFFDCFKSKGYYVGEWYVDLGSNAYIEYGFGYVTIKTITNLYIYEILASRIYVKNIREITFSEKSMRLLVKNELGTVTIEVNLK